MKLNYYDGNNNQNRLNTVIHANYQTHVITIENYTDNLIFRAFGINEHPTWKDYEEFLESRCFPRDRANCKDILNALGLSNIGYDPIEIIKKTNGRMADDTMYLEIEND